MEEIETLDSVWKNVVQRNLEWRYINSKCYIGGTLHTNLINNYLRQLHLYDIN